MPPNIVLIMADQMIAERTGLYGHPVVRTPNLSYDEETHFRALQYLAGIDPSELAEHDGASVLPLMEGPDDPLDGLSLPALFDEPVAEYGPRQYGFAISGAVEGSCKFLVQSRFKRPGSRWSAGGLRSMPALKLLRANDRWEVLWPHLEAA